jgi:hypothetical protein
MEFPLSNLFIVHWIRPYSRLCLYYKAKSIDQNNNHFFFKLENTIHYEALISGNYETYNEYVSITYQSDHNLEKYMFLKNNWNLELCRPIKIRFDKKLNKFVVEDGVHRLSLLKYFGIIKDSIPFSFLDFKISNDDIETIDKALKATTTGTLYNGWNNKRCVHGYHSFTFAGMNFIGQRNNIMRITELKKHINFLDKSVLDFGCNSGGLLLHLPEIKKGRGYDYDSTCINAANLINKTLKFHVDLLFQTADLEYYDLSLVASKGEFDILFLCSIGSWIRNWKTIYLWAISNVPLIVFEENNASEGATQIALFIENGCKVTKIIENSPDDTTGNRLRNTYLIECV